MSRQRQAFGLLTNQSTYQRQQEQQLNKKLLHKDSIVCSTTTTFKSISIQKNDQLKQDTNSFDLFQDDKENQLFNDFNIFCDSKNSENDQYHQQLDINIKNEPLKQLNILDVCDTNSPMVLDDSIKFQSSKSECEESIDLDDEVDVEKLRKLKLIENENVLKSCEEYSQDIIKHLRELELVNKAKPNYIKQQQDITSSMRSILVDWLVEVCEEYKLHTETLYLAVNYTDRFLSKMSVLRGKLQLLGTASIYIASKYEEIFPPDINDFVFITDDTYTKQQVLRMEHLILKVLNFHMNAPTPNCFLLYFLHTINADKKTEHLARYIAELTLIEAEPFLDYLPSQIAACALYLSLYTLNKLNNFNDKFQQLTGYKYNEIKKCLNDVYKCMCAAKDHAQQAIQEKYKQECYDFVALIEPPVLLNI